jgi:hypothetical protein
VVMEEGLCRRVSSPNKVSEGQKDPCDNCCFFLKSYSAITFPFTVIIWLYYLTTAV